MNKIYDSPANLVSSVQALFVIFSNISLSFHLNLKKIPIKLLMISFDVLCHLLTLKFIKDETIMGFD